MTQAMLAGCRVLDFGHFIAGPYCAALLADYGADVVRVERPRGASDRYVQPVGDGPQSEGAVYLQANRNKRSLALDVFSEAGRAVTRRLIAQADVVVANLPPGTLAAMGLDYATLQAVKPDIILVTCSAFGSEGDFHNRPGFDGIGQAMSGAMHMSGDAGVPRKAYAHYVDFCTAAMSAFGVVMALQHRDRSGQGQHVESSLLGTALATMNAGLIEQQLLHPDRQGSGNLAQLAGPADIFRTRDGWILLQVLGSGMFKRWCTLVGKEEWLDDPRFADDGKRGEHGALLSATMSEWCAGRSSEDCLAALRGVGLPTAPIYNFQQVLDDKVIAKQQFYQSQSFPGIGDYPVVDGALKLSQAPATLRRAAPALGEHSAEVLADYGFEAVEIEALQRDRVV